MSGGDSGGGAAFSVSLGSGRGFSAGLSVSVSTTSSLPFSFVFSGPFFLNKDRNLWICDSDPTVELLLRRLGASVAGGICSRETDRYGEVMMGVEAGVVVVGAGFWSFRH